MQTDPNQQRISPRVWFSLLLFGFLLTAIVITQYATKESRDSRTRAAGCSVNASFTVTNPTSIQPSWSGWDGHYYTFVFKSNLTRDQADSANKGWQGHNTLDSDGTTTITATGLEGGGIAYKGEVYLHQTTNFIKWANVSLTTTQCPSPPTVDIKASNSNGPITIAYNASSTLSWTSSNASSCTASNAWSGGKSTSGSQSTGNLTSSKTYTLTCTGTGGSASDSVTVNVAPPAVPVVDVSADSTNLSYNTGTTIRWTVSNATSCTASNAWSGSKNVGGGSEATGNLTSSKTYALSCTGTGGSSSDSVTVNVAAQQPPPPPPVGVNPPPPPPVNPPPVNPPPPPVNPPPPPAGGCIIFCTPPPPPPPLVTPPPNPSGPRLTPSGQQPAQAASSDITLNFAANSYLKGGMEVIVSIDSTGVSQKIVVDNKGGSFILKPGTLTKGVGYKLRVSSKNSLISAQNFSYADNLTLNISELVTGDFNNDNQINQTDLDKLLSAGFESQDSLYDINYDAVVNSIDYSLLLRNQGKTGT